MTDEGKLALMRDRMRELRSRGVPFTTAMGEAIDHVERSEDASYPWRTSWPPRPWEAQLLRDIEAERNKVDVSAWDADASRALERFDVVMADVVDGICEGG